MLPLRGKWKVGSEVAVVVELGWCSEFERRCFAIDEVDSLVPVPSLLVVEFEL